ncbi:alpha/beta hydrolase family esterase [Roseibium sp. SCP14]|uniref:alpha/beta hydrolase family esterase n=1 Tax=Roseibium sp. SCP14 TaxID=3141375 RepID=UPI00333C64D2
MRRGFPPPFFVALPISTCVLLASISSQAATCNPGELCLISNGAYRYLEPGTASQSETPVILYFHGFGSSSEAVLRRQSFVERVLERGYAFVALEGAKGGFFPNHRDWSIRDGSPSWRNEAAFARSVLDDLEQEVPIDRKRVLLAGFSRGGSAVWDIACHDPKGFTAFAPAAGALWRPMPEQCKEAVRLFHTHGWQDNVVPLEGRLIPNYPLRQGDVFESLQLMRDAAELSNDKPDGFETLDEMQCRHWADGKLRLCIHPYGHLFPSDWFDRVIDWFERK